MNDTDVAMFWQFVRGDMPAAQFETWLYRQEDLERGFGNDLYLELISANYARAEDVFDVREKLKAALRPQLKCECVTLADIAVVPMGMDGLDKRFFATIERVADYGSDKWWLCCARCCACGQRWMLAQEGRIYDDYFLKRLSHEEVQNIIDRHQWPTEFDTYEKVLDLGSRLSKPCRFVDPLSAELTDTARDLLVCRPEIPVERLAKLLGINADHVQALLTAR